jgi:hypothetical protein
VRLIDEAKRWAIKVDVTTVGFVVSSWVSSIMEKLNEQPENIQLFETIEEIMGVIKPLSLSLDLWKAQNIYFSISRNFYNSMKEKAERGDTQAEQWVDDFLKLGEYLHVKI